MKLSFGEIFKPTAILFAICVLVTAALAGTNLLTAERIAEQQRMKAEESRKIVLPGAESFEGYRLPANGEHEDIDFYLGRDGEGHAVGMVFETSAKGYGGDVKVMTGISVRDEQAITGVVILEHEETPGLGANAEKDSFRDQYVGLPAYDGEIEVVRYQTPVGQQIEAMTGASITSRAVTDAVNQALAEYNVLAGLTETMAHVVPLDENGGEG